MNGSWYYLDASGVMKTGWQGTNTGRYYLDPSGAMYMAVLKDNDALYYLAFSTRSHESWLAAGRWEPGII